MSEGTSPRDAVRPPWPVVCASLLRAALAWLVPASLLGLVPMAILGRVDLSDALGFGVKSFARTAAVLGVLGVLLGARGLRWPGSRLLAPLLAFAGAAALSLWWNHGVWGEFRILLTTIGLFVTFRSLHAGSPGGLRTVPWLGLFVVALVGWEIACNPGLLAFRESARNDLVSMHPNTLGFVLALVGPTFLAACLADRRAWPPRVFLAAAVLGVVLTFSRSAWMGFLVGCAVVVVGSRPAETRRRVIRRFLIGLGAVGAAVVTLSLDRQEADWQRLRIMATSLSIFREHWLLGIGMGITNLSRVFPQRYAELYGSELFLFHSHDQLVDLLVGTGVIGTLAALWFAARLVHEVLAALGAAVGERERLVALRSVAGVTVYFVLSLVDTPLYHTQVMLLASLLLAVVEPVRAQAAAPDLAERPRLERAAGAPAAGLGAVG